MGGVSFECFFYQMQTSDNVIVYFKDLWKPTVFQCLFFLSLKKRPWVI